MIDYPREFSPEARARIEAEMVRARRDFRLRRAEITSSYGPSAADEENFRQYVLRVFLAFAKEACKLGSLRVWTVDKITPECVEFLRRFTIQAYYEDGHDRNGRRLISMTSNLNGSLLEEVERQYRGSEEWRQFEDALLAVAEQVATASHEDSSTAPPIVREWEAFKAIKKLMAGPHEEVPEAFLRNSISRELGIEPKDVTFSQIRHAVTALLPRYPAIRLVPSKGWPFEGKPEPSGSNLEERAIQTGRVDEPEQSRVPTGEPSETNNAAPVMGSMDKTSEHRALIVDAFLLRCNERVDAGTKVIRKHIWGAIGHRQPRQFQYWQAGDGQATEEDDQNFRRILSMEPSDFIAILKQKKLI